MKRTAKTPSKLSYLLNRIICLAILLFLVVGGFGLGTIYLRHKSAQAANEIRDMEKQVSRLKVKISEQGAELTRLTTRSSLKQLNTYYAMGLEMPRERQIVRVLEDPTKRLYEKTSGTMLTVSSF